LQANEKFFIAQSTGDLDSLLQLWSHSEGTICTTNIVMKVSNSAFSLPPVLNAALLQGKTECSNIVGGLQNITNYFARHTPTFRDYALRDVRLTFYVSMNCILVLACLATALFLSFLAFLPSC
jgi:hypothetical protein